MPIRQTLKQTQQKEMKQHLHLTYTLPKSKVKTVEAASPQPSESTSSSDTALFGYPATLIYRDILKTLVVATVTVAMLIALVVFLPR